MAEQLARPMAGRQFIFDGWVFCVMGEPLSQVAELRGAEGPRFDLWSKFRHVAFRRASRGTMVRGFSRIFEFSPLTGGGDVVY